MRERLDQPQLGIGAGDRNCFEQRPRTRAQSNGTREDRVADGPRNVVARSAEDLGDEEGVARRLAEELVRIHAVRPGERGDRLE